MLSAWQRVSCAPGRQWHYDVMSSDLNHYIGPIAELCLLVSWEMPRLPVISVSIGRYQKRLSISAQHSEILSTVVRFLKAKACSAHCATTASILSTLNRKTRCANASCRVGRLHQKKWR